MAKVFREVVMSWDGEDYTFAPSNRLLRRIDAGLAPQTLLGVIGSMDGVNLPLPAIAYILSEMLSEGGADVDEDDVLAGLYDDMESNNGDGVGTLVQAIGECVTPPGNGQSPVKSGGKPKKKPVGKKPARK